MAAERDHSWVAATLVHLRSAEAKQVSVDPASIDDLAPLAPRELVGPLCIDCGASFDDSSIHRLSRAAGTSAAFVQLIGPGRSMALGQAAGDPFA
jgi:hypothetical protein